MKRFLTTATALLFGATLLAACGDDFRSYDDIEDAIDNPTAPITGTTISAAFEQNRAQNSDAVSQSAGQAGAPSFVRPFGGAGKSLLVPARVARFLPSALPANVAQALGDGACQDFGPLARGEVTLDMDAASGGEVTGSITYEISGETTCDFELKISLDAVCGTVDNACVSGAMGFLIKYESLIPMNGKIVTSGNLTFTAAGEEATLEWGIRISYDEALATGEIEFAAFVEYEGESASLVIEASQVDGDGTVTVRGNNGEFTCTYTNSGEAGSCTGTEGDVTWQ